MDSQWSSYMNYYKTILPNEDKVKYFSSNNLVWYSNKLKTFIGGDEKDSEYVLIDEQIFRIPWLKYEKQETKGKYPVINAQYALKEEYDAYMEEKMKKQEEEFEKMRLLKK